MKRGLELIKKLLIPLFILTLAYPIIAQDNPTGDSSCPQNTASPSRQDCEMSGMVLVRQIDANGCLVKVCMDEEEAEVLCPKDVPELAFRECETQGGELIVKKDAKGECITFLDCIKPGDESEIIYENVSNIPPLEKLIAAAMALEKAKRQFEKIEKELNQIAEYYESSGKPSEAERFRRGAEIISEARAKIEEIENLKDRLDTLTLEDLTYVKRELKYIVQVSLPDARYVILSEETTMDCGQNVICFEENIRTCTQSKTTSHSPREDTIQITIQGMNQEQKCQILIKETQSPERASMTCTLPGRDMPNTDQLTQYCEGPLTQKWNITNCGQNIMCFEENIRSCTPAKITSHSPREDTIQIIIRGPDPTNPEKCQLLVKGPEELDMSCILLGRDMPNTDQLTQYCEGPLTQKWDITNCETNVINCFEDNIRTCTPAKVKSRSPRGTAVRLIIQGMDPTNPEKCLLLVKDSEGLYMNCILPGKYMPSTNKLPQYCEGPLTQKWLK